MLTLEEQFNTRVGAFLDSTGVSPTTLGMLAVGDPNLLRQIERGRSPSLRTADRVLAFIAAYKLDSGGARAPPGRTGGPMHRAGAREPKRSRAMSERETDEGTRPRTRFLRISEVEARTGLSRSTIYEWSADGRFPPPVRLSDRVVRWVEAEVEAWMSERLEKSPGR
ncbi:MAG: AlpA family transcriptional regulator [Gemmatimonadetes bacterium]|nr:AlpA family transcriptional regulator [Candidatus Palauibacter rhopaloidicola]